MNLKTVDEVPEGTKLVLRLDTDLPIEDGQILDNSRLTKSLPTIKELLNKKCRMVVVGYLGRPAFVPTDIGTTAGKPAGFNESLSLKPVYMELMSLLESDGQDWVNSVFVDNVEDTTLIDQSLANNEIVFLENARFWPGEEENDPNFLQNLTQLCACFVMDAFAAAHRNEMSVTMHRRMPGFYGYSFIEEVEKIKKILDNPQKPITVILGGAKEDKLDYIDGLLKIADNVLVGGKLAQLIQNPSPASRDLPLTGEAKIVIARLREDKLDLSDEDINKFREIIGKSKTVIWVGAMGKYEEEKSRKGTEEIAKAVAESMAYKVIAGGDTGAAVRELGLENRVDFISSGGGAMLTLLTKGSLPAWE